MATIEARKSCSGISYRAKVRVKGHSLITATFTRKTDAKRWAAGIEAAIHSGRYFPETHHTLAELYELEMLSREFGLISADMVGRNT